MEQCLNNDTLKIAKEELREDEATRDNALRQMRLWLKQNKKIIHSRSDDSFLLRFLRAKKFSLPLAQEALERYLLLRQTFGHQLFNALDITCPRLEKLLELGYIFVVPKRDKNGRRIIITRPGHIIMVSRCNNANKCVLNFFNVQASYSVCDILTNSLRQYLAWSLVYTYRLPNRFMSFEENHERPVAYLGVFNPSIWTNAEMCRMHGVTYETLMEDQENQIRGFVHYTDAAGMCLQQLTLFTPREAVRIVKNGERTLPMRHKEIYGVNIPLSLKFALDFGMTLISEKIRSRVKIFSSIEESHKYVDKSLLPKEYGGEMEMSKMIGLWKQELLEKREQILKNEKMSVREDMFSEGARQGRVSALTNHSHHHMVGSFRQLTVD